MTLQTFFDDGDVLYADSVNWTNGIVAGSIQYVYSGTSIGSIIQTVSGGTIEANYIYNADTTIGSIIEVRNGDSKTITTKFTYSGGNITDIVKVVT